MKEESPSPGNGFFTHNIGLKLASLVAALILFSLVRGAEDAQRSIFVDVIANLPLAESGKLLISEPPDQVRLTLKGSRSQINSLRPEDIPAVEIDLRDTDLRYYYFADDEFDVPAGITITQVAPTSIPLTWANRIERRVPAQVRLVGQPAEGLALAQPPRVDPEEVLVVGPDTEVDVMRTVRTEPLELSELGVGRHETRLALTRPPPHTRFATDNTVLVTLEIVPDLAERTFPGQPIELTGPGEISPARVTVTLRGAPGVLDLIDPARVKPTADVSALDPTSGSMLTVQIEGLPAGVEVVSVEPPLVEYVAVPL